MSLSQLFVLAWVRRWVLLSIIGLAVLSALAANQWLPKKYVGRAAVVVDLNGGDPLKDGTLAPQMQTTYVATQVDVISSDNVALKVVDRMKLVEKPEVRAAFEQSAARAGSIRDWAADRLQSNLKVQPPGNSNVIYLEYSSPNPQDAAAFANAFAQSYIDTSIALKVDPAQQQTGWFEEQVQNLRKTLEDAKQKLSAYQSAHNVIGADEGNKLDVEQARLEQLSNQLAAAQNEMYQATAREQQMNDGSGADRDNELPDVLKNQLLQTLKSELARSEAKFADVSKRFSENHPVYQSAAAERDALRSRVATEISTAKGNIAREASLARQQVRSLQQSVEQQRSHILSLGHTQDEYSVLKREVDSAQGAYDAALQRTSQTQLESRLDHSNIAILSRATVPLFPSSPRPFLNIVLAVVFGSLFGMGVIVAAESFSRRIRSRSDILETAQLPLLAELPPEGRRTEHYQERAHRIMRLRREPDISPLRPKAI